MEICKIENMNESAEYIKIRVGAVDDKLDINLDLSRNIKKYFLNDSFAILYDKNIEDVDKSILTIPALFIVAPVAWAAGAHIYVERADQTSLESLGKVMQLFQKWFPIFSFAGKIYVKEITTNELNNDEPALLFSGGVDSLASYIRHKDEHPILITMLRGASASSYEHEYYEKMRRTFLRFAKGEEVEIHFIKSDVWDPNSNVLNNQLLSRDFGVSNWWVKVSHGLIFLGLSAPLTTERIGTIYLASTYSRDFKISSGQGSHFLADMDFSWADVKVRYDVAELSRHAKIKHILRKNTQYLKYLRVCNPDTNPWYQKDSGSQSYIKNCGFCNKCVRTITELILEGIDPTQCNFEISDKVLGYVKRLLTTGSLNLSGTQPEYWRDIQRHIPDVISENPLTTHYEMKKFFEWFQHFDVSSYKHTSNEKLRMIRWAYCLMRYRGAHYTIRLVLSHLRKNQAAFS